MKKTLHIRKDQLWKGAIEDLFEDFMHFFYPDYVDEIDFSKPVEFLDKELQQIYPEANTESINRRADMLVRVYLKNGAEKWLLVHIEVQGYKDEDFALRMFVYYYRIYDKYAKEITGIAVLTDDNRKFRPQHFEQRTWNTKIRYDFDMFKVIDYDEDYYKKFENPFASLLQVVRTHIRYKQVKSDEDLLDLKLQLFRIMLQKGHTKKVIRNIATFIKFYVNFKHLGFYDKFEEDIFVISKKEKSMGLMELATKHRELEIAYIAEKKGMEKGIEKGMEKGMEKGIEKGIEKGMEKGIDEEKRKVIANLIKHGFSIEEIVKMMDYKVEEVEKIVVELKIEKFLKQEKNLEFIQKELDVTEEIVMKVKKRILDF